MQLNELVCICYHPNTDNGITVTFYLEKLNVVFT